MGSLRWPQRELLVIAAFSRRAEALHWAAERLQQCYGPMAFSGPPFDFVQTAYYEPTMGPDLRKLFHVFERTVAPDALARIKTDTNALEDELARSGRFREARPLNLDPGLMSLGKFVLATTKDQAHRIYLGQGIFAEPTLRFQDGEFRTWPWTYADYQLPHVREFLGRAREFYKTVRGHTGDPEAD